MTQSKTEPLKPSARAKNISRLRVPIWLIDGFQAKNALQQTVEQNPLLVAGIGLILGGLIASALPKSDLEDDLMGDASEAVRRHAGRAAKDALSSAKDTADQIISNVSSKAEMEGLTPSAIGLAVGAVVAASLPSTDIESEYLGQTSSTVRKTVEEIAGQAMERATERGSQVAGAMMEEAKQQGLTTEGVKAAAGEMADSLKSVAQAARLPGE